MSAVASLDLILKSYFASLDYPHTQEPSADELSQVTFSHISYSDAQKVEINQWLVTSARFAAPDEDAAKQAERLRSLNTHLATRTTLLGSSPSIADVALYARVAPQVASWSPEERTGEHGYHHIVRYIDFVQNAPLFGIQVPTNDKVVINPDDVVFVHKPIDAKAEKERKKKEKAAAAAASAATAGTAPPAGGAPPGARAQSTLVVGQGPGSGVGVKTPAEKAAAAVAASQAASQTSNQNSATTDGAAPTGKKKEKKEKAPKAPKAASTPAEKPLSPSLIDLRVGHILKATTHPNADSLYVSTIAVGDAPGTDNTSEYEGQIVRTVCSGLNGLVPLEEMQGRKIVAVCNLKPVTMRGVKSSAMVLAASPRPPPGAEDDGHGGGGHDKVVELVSPPSDAQAGDRIVFEGWDDVAPEAVLNPKKKVWDMCQVGFTTTADHVVAFAKARVEQLATSASTNANGAAGPAATKPDLALLVVQKSGKPCTVKSLADAVVR